MVARGRKGEAEEEEVVEVGKEEVEAGKVEDEKTGEVKAEVAG